MRVLCMRWLYGMGGSRLPPKGAPLRVPMRYKIYPSPPRVLPLFVEGGKSGSFVCLASPAPALIGLGVAMHMASAA